MANIYVRSTDGNDADDGSTWALAKATLAGASAIDAAGDTVYVSQAHAESVASVSAAFVVDNTNPVRILCANDSAEPPTALATGATVTTTGTAFTWTGAAYTYGTNFIFSTNSSATMNFSTSNGISVYEACAFRLTGSGGTRSILFGSVSANIGQYSELRDCTFRFSASTNRIFINRTVKIVGGSWESGGTSPASVFTLANGARTANLFVENFDFSNLSSTVNLVGTIIEGGSNATFRNCKLPASWSGSIIASGAIRAGSRMEMYNCDSADTNYRLWIEDLLGSIKSETTIIRSGGASDGTTGLSWVMESSTSAAYPLGALYSPDIVIWNETVGSAVTATIEVVHDSVGAGTSGRLTDEEMWVEVSYYGTSGFPIGTAVRDVKSNVLATAADQTDSSETWTTTGLTTPLKQKLSVTFTPQEKGYFIAKVCLGKGSKVVYVDPKITIS